VSDITQIKYGQQPTVFPFPADAGFTPAQPLTVNLQNEVISVWTGFESGNAVVGDETLFSLVQSAIQKQRPDATLNSLNWGNTSEIQYSAAFTPPPPDAAYIGAGGVISITLFVPGDSLAFTTGGARFDVAFDLVVNIQLTLPVSLAPIFAGGQSDWSVSASVTAQVEAHSVTSHNVGVFLCDRSAVTNVLQAINGQIVSVPNVVVSQLSLVNNLIQASGQVGCTQLIQTDDGAGTLVLTAVAPGFTINGASNDTIQINRSIFGPVEITAGHGQSGTILPDALDSITINLASGTNNVGIIGVPPGVTVTIDSQQQGNSTVTIGGALPSSGLPTLAGATINVNAASGVINLVVDDSADTTGRVTQVTSTAVTFTGLTTVNYSGAVASVRVIGGSGNNQIFVSSVAASTPTIVDAGGGANAVYAGAPGTDPGAAGTGDGSVFEIAGPLNILDSSGATSLTIDASGRYVYFQVYSNNVTFTAGPTINFANASTLYKPTGIRGAFLRETVGVSSLTIYGSSAGNNFDVQSVGPDTTVIIWGTADDQEAGPALGEVTHKIYPPGMPPIRKI
jgi:hypothetical protein